MTSHSLNPHHRPEGETQLELLISLHVTVFYLFFFFSVFPFFDIVNLDNLSSKPQLVHIDNPQFVFSDSFNAKRANPKDSSLPSIMEKLGI